MAFLGPSSDGRTWNFKFRTVHPFESIAVLQNDRWIRLSNMKSDFLKDIKKYIDTPNVDELIANRLDMLVYELGGEYRTPDTKELGLPGFFPTEDNQPPKVGDV